MSEVEMVTFFEVVNNSEPFVVWNHYPEFFSGLVNLLNDGDGLFAGVKRTYEVQGRILANASI